MNDPKRSSNSALADLLERLDSGELTISEFTHARPAIREAVARLRDADARIAAAQLSLLDRFAVAALTHYGNGPTIHVYDIAAVAMQRRPKS